MTEQQTTPELRFPEFKDEWNKSKLAKVVNVYDGTHQTPRYTKEGIRFLSVENIRSLKSNKYISVEDFEKEFKIYPEYGDVLMTRIGDIGTPKVVNLRESLAYYVSLALLKPININSYFLESLILSPTVQNELWRKTLHIAFPKKINKNEIAKVMLNYPKNEEQEKIGDFFSKLDRQIELEEEKLELLEQQKKGYMQKIFSQELRFKDEKGGTYPNWKNEALGSIVKITMGQSPSSKNYTENSSYTILVQGNADLNNGCIKPRIYTKQVTKLAEVNDILLTVRAPVGKIGRAQLKACIGRGVCAIKGDIFIYYFLELFDLQNKWIKFSQGSTFESVSGNEIKSIDIAYPTNEERQKISKFLSKLDELLKNQLLKIELLKQRKQGLLQKMFV